MDVILVNQERLQREGASYVRPFNAIVEERVTSAGPDKLTLRDPPADRVLFRAGPLSVVRAGPPREGFPPARAVPAR